jgi:lipopolysaccharide heptosyltransferase I
VSAAPERAASQTRTGPRFLIVRLGALGDVVHAIPVAAALRAEYPTARIDWMVDPRNAPVVRLVTAVDHAVAVDPRAGLIRLMATLKELRRVRYKVAIDLQGLLKSAVLARMAGAGRTVGFPQAHLREPMARMFYTDTPDPGSAVHVVRKNMGLLAGLGFDTGAPMFPLDVPRTPAVEAVDAMFAGAPFALINPGAAWPNKRWPAARFGVLAASIRDRFGWPSLIVWGPREDDLAAAVVGASGGAARVAPATGVVDLFGIAKAARVVISGDTGPLHIAGAVGTPTVSLFGPTKAERNGPWSDADIAVTRTAQCECLYQRECRRGAPCIDDIAAAEVFEAVVRRVEHHG